MFGVAANVRLIPIKALMVVARVTGIGIRCPTFGRGLNVGTFAAGFDQRRVYRVVCLTI